MKNKLFLALFIVGALASCSKKALKCNDKDVVKTAAEIVKDEYNTSVLPTIKNIRTKGQDEKLKSCECEAEVSVMGEDFDIVYTAEHTEDGNIYVQLFKYDEDNLNYD